MTISGNYPYEISPHLAEYNVPFPDFISSHPEYSAFIVGAFIFFTRSARDGSEISLTPSTTSTVQSENDPALCKQALFDQQPCVLLLQRSLSDSYGGLWEGPGGSCEDTDATLLDSLAREVLEESGLHVSHVRELVATEKWEIKGGRGTAMKYSFLVDVYEAGSTGNKEFDASIQIPPPDGWECRIKLAPGEHEDYVWATEEEVQSAIDGKEDKIKLKLAQEEQNILKAFKIYHSLRSSPTVNANPARN